MREYFGDLVFDTVIHRSVRVAEAPSAGESVLTYAQGSRGAAEYLALAEEIISGKPSGEERSSGEAETTEVDDSMASEEGTSGSEAEAGEVVDSRDADEETGNGEDATKEVIDSKLWTRR